MEAAHGGGLNELAFASHVRIGEQRFRERAGLDFEDFEAGQLFKHRPGPHVHRAREPAAHRALARSLPPREKDVRFPPPVRPGHTVYAESEILGTRESRSRATQGLVHLRTRALDQRGEEVCSFERNFLVYRRGQGPYVDAGY